MKSAICAERDVLRRLREFPIESKTMVERKVVLLSVCLKSVDFEVTMQS